VAIWAGVTGVLDVALAFRRGATAGERAMWAITGLVSIVLSAVLFNGCRHPRPMAARHLLAP